MTLQKKPSLSSFNSLAIRTLVLLCVISLSACSPKFDWREVNDNDAPYVALFPAKPNYHTKELELDGIRVKMTMTGADVDKLSFAVAYAKIETAENNLEKNKQAQARILAAMQAGMINNIHGTIIAQSANPIKDSITVIGRSQNGKEVRLVGRFIAHGPYVLQAVVIGENKSFTPENLEMFFSSIKLK